MTIFFKALLSSILIAITFTACSVKVENSDKTTEPTREMVREKITDLLITEIYEIIFALENRDLQQLHRYIHPTFGFYDVFKLDGMQSVVHKKSIDNDVYEGLEELSHVLSERDDDINFRAIKIATPDFNCSYDNDKNYGWNDSGLFINAHVKTYLSDYMNEFNKTNQDFYTKEDFYKAKIIEKTGYQVVLTPFIVFYVTKLDDRFYITLFDRAVTDCVR